MITKFNIVIFVFTEKYQVITLGHHTQRKFLNYEMFPDYRKFVFLNALVEVPARIP